MSDSRPASTVPATPTDPPASPFVARAALPKERATTIDALRGVAILGILLLNIRSFGLPNVAYQLPSIVSNTTADLWAYSVTTVVAQSKFITIFATLYGAGILLSTRRADEAGVPAFGTFFRRSAILAGVGLIHLTLIWHGDILLAYAVIGMLAFPVRRLSSQWLWIFAIVGNLITVLLFAALAFFMWAGVTHGDMPPSKFYGGDAAIAAEVAAYRGGWLDEQKQRLMNGVMILIFMFIFFLPNLWGLMCAGMALLRNGFLTGGWSAKRYIVGGVAGVVIGMGGSAIIVALGWQNGWPVVGYLGVGQAALLPFALVASFGIASLLIGHVAAGKTPWLTVALAACGRMAFTNYLAQSVLATTFFYTFNWFGHLGYAKQLLAVAAIWALEIAWSVLWLSRFRYGPLEWVWRGLSYGKFPPLRREAAAVRSGDAQLT